MAIDVSALCDSLEAEYLAIEARLAAAGGLTTFSDQGRSQSIDVAALTARMQEIERKLAGLGRPIGTLAVPFVTASRHKA